MRTLVFLSCMILGVQKKQQQQQVRNKAVSPEKKKRKKRDFEKMKKSKSSPSHMSEAMDSDEEQDNNDYHSLSIQVRIVSLFINTIDLHFTINRNYKLFISLQLFMGCLNTSRPSAVDLK